MSDDDLRIAHPPERSSLAVSQWFFCGQRTLASEVRSLFAISESYRMRFCGSASLQAGVDRVQLVIGATELDQLLDLSLVA